MWKSATWLQACKRSPMPQLPYILRYSWWKKFGSPVTRYSVSHHLQIYIYIYIWVLLYIPGGTKKCHSSPVPWNFVHVSPWPFPVITKSHAMDWFLYFPPWFSWSHHLLGGGFKFFYFHPYLGEWSNLTDIFQMRWNHQLVLEWSFWLMTLPWFGHEMKWDFCLPSISCCVKC